MMKGNRGGGSVSIGIRPMEMIVAIGIMKVFEAPQGAEAFEQDQEERPWWVV